MGWRRWLVVVFVVAGVTSAAFGKDLRKARKHNEQAISYFKKGEYRKAVEQFELAFKHYPTPLLLYNIAQSYEKLREYRQAITFYRKYLELKRDAEDKEKVLATIELLKTKLGPQVGRLRITTDPPGARVIVDSDSAKAGLVTPVMLELPAGEHLIEVHLGGYKVKRRSIKTLRGEERKLHIRLQQITSQGELKIEYVGKPGSDLVFVDGTLRGTGALRLKLPVGRHTVHVRQGDETVWKEEVLIRAEKTAVIRLGTPIKRKPPRHTRLWPAAWATLGVGFGSLIAGGVLHGLAYKGASDANDLRPQDFPTFPDYEDEAHSTHSSAKNKWIGAMVMYGVGGAAVATSVVLFVLDMRRKSPQRSRRVEVLPAVVGGNLGVGLSARF